MEFMTERLYIEYSIMRNDMTRHIVFIIVQY